MHGQTNIKREGISWIVVTISISPTNMTLLISAPQQIKAPMTVSKCKVLVVRDFADGLLLDFSFDASVYSRIEGFAVSCYLLW
jgi:hypothetical protein